MVSSCAVPFCTNRYSKGLKIRLYRPPLRKRKLLKTWLARIGCESIPVMQTRESATNIMKERQKWKDWCTIYFCLDEESEGENLLRISEQYRWTTGCVWITIPPSTGNGVSDTESHSLHWWNAFAQFCQHRHASQQRNSLSSRWRSRFRG